MGHIGHHLGSLLTAGEGNNFHLTALQNGILRNVSNGIKPQSPQGTGAILWEMGLWKNYTRLTAFLVGLQRTAARTRKHVHFMIMNATDSGCTVCSSCRVGM